MMEYSVGNGNGELIHVEGGRAIDEVSNLMISIGDMVLFLGVRHV